jgi:hypothetical protein
MVKDMYGIAIMGFVFAAGIFILICKINLEYFCKYHWQTDVLFTFLATWIFWGTFSGMATAAVAGLTFSGILYIAKVVLDV